MHLSHTEVRYQSTRDSPYAQKSKKLFKQANLKEAWET